MTGLRIQVLTTFSEYSSLSHICTRLDVYQWWHLCPGRWVNVASTITTSRRADLAPQRTMQDPQQLAYCPALSLGLLIHTHHQIGSAHRFKAGSFFCQLIPPIIPAQSVPPLTLQRYNLRKFVLAPAEASNIIKFLNPKHILEEYSSKEFDALEPESSRPPSSFEMAD